MSHLLEPGRRFRVGAAQGTVGAFLGAGGQGEVYRAELDGAAVALKWYLPHAATPAQRTLLHDLVARGAPDARFLWPMGLAEADGVPGFGYVMRLRPPAYRGIVDLLAFRTSPTFRALATAGFQLADSFLTLHTRGLCYRDVSYGNVFFDPGTGDVLICDNDNVAVDRADGAAAVDGTPRFMAPEIVRGEARPSTETDLFSLGVLLFYMFMVHHPLEGRREAEIHCFDLAAMRRLYGSEPVFVFDPDDATNRPVPGAHDNALVYWGLYPAFVRDLFTRHFTGGLHDPQRRVRESEWRAAMVQLRDAIVYCTGCGGENFYDPAVLQRTGGQAGACWRCGEALRLPPRLRLGGRDVVVLNFDTRLFPHHLAPPGDARRYDFSAPVAEVTQHPRHPDTWGLRNLTSDAWSFRTAAGDLDEVAPGRNVRLAPGTTILFGKTEGEIRL